jgi:hypothetical protein
VLGLRVVVAVEERAVDDELIARPDGRRFVEGERRGR